MDNTIQDYIENTLNKIAILDELDVAFENVEVFEFKTHHENGKVFTHQNGEAYGMAFLNAVTQESAGKITKEIKKNKNLSVKNLQDLVEKHRLKCYVKGGSKSYDTWQAGDTGVVFLEADDERKAIIPKFVNETAKARR